jgi:L-lysine 2,3-aminomutase
MLLAFTHLRSVLSKTKSLCIWTKKKNPALSEEEAKEAATKAFEHGAITTYCETQSLLLKRVSRQEVLLTSLVAHIFKLLICSIGTVPDCN